MKRKIDLLLTFLLALTMSVFAFVSCTKKGEAKAEVVSKTDTKILIKINETEGFATLLDAMTYLKEEGELIFTVSGGMVSSVEGKENAADWSACWMLYTSDTEMSNKEWGTITYEGNLYGSAILGVESLQVSVGEYYLLSYDTF